MSLYFVVMRPKVLSIFIASLLLLEGQPCEKKLEGIAVRSVNKRGEIGVITVCDNDDGTSDIISFDVVIK